MKKIGIFLICLVLVLLGLWYLYKKNQTTHLPPHAALTQESELLANIAVWYPSAPWSAPQGSTQTTFYGNLSGEQMSATVKNQQPMLNHFEDVHALQQKGFMLDNNLLADGPGSSVWGYTTQQGNTKQVILFSYKTQPSSNNPNQPLQFNCPCNIYLTVFVSLPFSTTSLANPASVNCTKQGGTLFIKKRGDGGEYGLCDFGDNMQCEEWALLRGDCPVGGIKTTGFDTIEQKYCAWLGGKTYAVPNAQCTFSNGKTCSDSALYNGACSN